MLWRNDAADGAWLRVRPVEKSGSRESIGARVTVHVVKEGSNFSMVRSIGAEAGFLGQSEAVAHFGLGKGSPTVSEVHIQWPSGEHATILNVQSNSTL